MLASIRALPKSRGQSGGALRARARVVSSVSGHESVALYECWADAIAAVVVKTQLPPPGMTQ